MRTVRFTSVKSFFGPYEGSEYKFPKKEEEEEISPPTSPAGRRREGEVQGELSQGVISVSNTPPFSLMNICT